MWVLCYVAFFLLRGGGMLERHHLEIVRAVVEEGTLTRAAERLFLTQPALSHTIRKLEDTIGASVWEKDGRRVRLTRAGEYLYQLALSVLPRFERGEVELLRFAQGLRGSLRIGMECHPCYQWLLKQVRPFLQAWPEVDVDVRQQFQFKGIAALYAYEVDILITPDPVLGDGLRFVPVFPYELCLVLHQTHPLAQKSLILPEDLQRETLFTYPVPVERLDIFQQFLVPAQYSVAHHKTIETTEILLEMVAANRGVSALPRWLVEEQASALPIVCRTLGERGIHKHIYMGIREKDAEVDYIRGFAEVVGVG